MTENEAKTLLESKKEEAKRITNNFLSYSGGEIRKANRTIEMCDMAIQALEEIQQYRAIGTVEELEEAKIQFDNINLAANSVALMGLCDFETAKEAVITEMKRNLDYSLKEYQAIGTVEEFKELKDEQQNKCKDCAGCTMWKCDCVNERAYAIDEFAENIEKYCSMSDMNRKMIKQIAEQMKAGGENE